MIVFVSVGLTTFTENVRAVQVVGLLGCGAVFGAALAGVISGFKRKENQA